MKITKADVGRKVVLKNGRTALIETWDGGAVFPIKLNIERHGNAVWLTREGWYWASEGDPYDAVKFVDEPKTPVADFSATQSQAALRPLKANSQAFRFAKALLLGRKLSHQDFVRMLERAGIVSNSPQRRMSEARKWLRDRGVFAKFKLEGKKHPQHKLWYIQPTAKAKKLLTEMKGYA